jgi:hypothetical protein
LCPGAESCTELLCPCAELLCPCAELLCPCAEPDGRASAAIVPVPFLPPGEPPRPPNPNNALKFGADKLARRLRFPAALVPAPAVRPAPGALAGLDPAFAVAFRLPAPAKPTRKLPFDPIELNFSCAAIAAGEMSAVDVAVDMLTVRAPAGWFTFEGGRCDGKVVAWRGGD